MNYEAEDGKTNCLLRNEGGLGHTRVVRENGREEFTQDVEGRRGRKGKLERRKEIMYIEEWKNGKESSSLYK